MGFGLQIHQGAGNEAGLGEPKNKTVCLQCLKMFQLLVFAKGSVQVVLNITSPCSQYCGGTSFITKLLDSVIPSAETPRVLLDLFGFDSMDGQGALLCHKQPGES